MKNIRNRFLAMVFFAALISSSQCLDAQVVTNNPDAGPSIEVFELDNGDVLFLVETLGIADGPTEALARDYARRQSHDKLDAIKEMIGTGYQIVSVASVDYVSSAARPAHGDFAAVCRTHAVIVARPLAPVPPVPLEL